MKQQQDFYNLASNCMKSSMNITQMTEGTWDNRQHQQHHQLHNENRQHYDNHYDNDYHHQDTRYDRNKMNLGQNEGWYDNLVFNFT